RNEGWICKNVLFDYAKQARVVTDSVSSAYCSLRIPERVPGKAEDRRKVCIALRSNLISKRRIAIGEYYSIERVTRSRDPIAISIDLEGFAWVVERRIKIGQLSIGVVRLSEERIANTNVDCQIRANPVIVLNEEFNLLGPHVGSEVSRCLRE